MVQISTQRGVETASTNPYVIVPVDRAVMPFVARADDIDSLRSLGDRRPAADLTLGTGDVIAIRIFEASPGGLFTPPESSGSRPGNYAEVPNQEVDRSGNVSVPYAGLINVRGRTAAQVGQMIEDKLKSRAIEPQVIVSLVDRRSAQISVVGEVNTPTSFSLLPKGERVLDAVARAEGLKIPDYEAYVTVQRRGQKVSVPFTNLVSNPANNIYLQPDDVVYLSRKQKTFMALGASGLNGQIDFGADKLTLAQAVGKSGGLLDARANPAAVAVFRMEPRSKVTAMGYDLKNISGTLVPTIYTVNMRDPGGFFIAGTFQMKPDDVIYVSNAAFADLTKVTTAVRGVTQIRSDMQ